MNQVHSESIVLVNGGVSKYVVTINSGASYQQEERAANLFRYYVQQATGINLPITVSKDFDYRIDFKLDSSLADGSFRISNLKSNLLVSGGNENGVMNASAFVLKYYLKIDFLSAGNVNVPVLKNVVIKTPVSILQRPSFKMRTIHSIEGYYLDYIDANNLQLPFKEYLAFPNTFNYDILQSQVYYKTHPEYYSVRAGKRDTIQPDLLQPQVVELVKQKVSNAIKKHDSIKPIYYNIFLNDNPFVSEDTRTQQAINSKASNYSNLYFNFVNKIASSFPEKQFLALAYEQTKSVPLATMLNKNVTAVLTNADNNKSKSLQEDDYDVQQNIHMKAILPKWLVKDPDLIYWDYIANFTNSLMPWPNLYTIKPNLKFYKKVGIKNLFLQGSGLFPSENSELKAYLCSSLMWNIDYNDDSLIQSFCTKFYNTSGKVMYQYIKEINKQALLGKETMYTYDGPEKFSKSFFSFINVRKWQTLLLNAEKNEANSTIAKRIMKERVGLDCVYIQLSTEIKGWNTIDGKGTLNRKIDSFLKDLIFLNITRISDTQQDIQKFTQKLRGQNQ